MRARPLQKLLAGPSVTSASVTTSTSPLPQLVLQPDEKRTDMAEEIRREKGLEGDKEEAEEQGRRRGC